MVSKAMHAVYKATRAIFKATHGIFEATHAICKATPSTLLYWSTLEEKLEHAQAHPDHF